MEAYARSRDQQHWPAWMAFNKRIGNSRGDVGIWHETYAIAACAHESVYVIRPAFGLGRAGSLEPATGRKQSAADLLMAPAPLV